jgi:hypothetical protein
MLHTLRKARRIFDHGGFDALASRGTDELLGAISAYRGLKRSPNLRIWIS